MKTCLYQELLNMDETLNVIMQVPNISYSHGKDHKGLVHLLPHIPHPFLFISRYSSSHLFSPLFSHVLLTFYSFGCSYSFECLPNVLRACLCQLQDMDLEDDAECAQRKRKEGEDISLPPFGLATYKMQGNVWVSGKSGRDQERLMSLLSVADSWLKQLWVQHHDFNYFMGIRRG